MTFADTSRAQRSPLRWLRRHFDMAKLHRRRMGRGLTPWLLRHWTAMAQVHA